MNISKFLSKVLLFLLLFLNFSIIYSTNEVNSAQYLKLNITHSLSFELEEKENSAFNYLYLYSYYLPQTINSHQYLNEYSTTSSGEISILGGEEIPSMKYSYLNSPQNLKEEFDTTFIVESTPNFPKISQQQRFPYTAFEIRNYSNYLKFTEQININDDIRFKALELAQGENDSYIIATKIANWLQEEIKYDLSTVFENPNQKATEIFESKRGVCKELSIIYSSMLKSLDIPTRMVMGYAHTNSEEIIDLVGSNWGGHAWVEVFIGDEWVPFDLTYQQYGYVDSSHIVFQYTPDISQLGVQMEMSAVNYLIKDNSLKSSFDFNLESINGNFNPLSVESKLDSQYIEIKPNSEIKIIANFINSENYYQSFPVELVYPREVINQSPKKQIVYLKPNEIKSIDFYVKMPNLDGYIFPFSLYSQNLELSNISIFLDDRKDLIIETKKKENDINTQISLDLLNNNENNIKYNLLYNCDFKSRNSQLYTSCLISNISQINEISLCSTVECIKFKNENLSTSTEIEVKSSISSRYSILADDEVQNFYLELELPTFKYDYSIENNVFSFSTQTSEINNLDYSILFESGPYSLEVNNTNSNSSIQLPTGKFSGVVYFYYVNELVGTETISFEIEESNLLLKILDFISNIL